MSGKSYWNYRVIRRKSPDPDDEWDYSIYECWYDRGQKASDVPDLWTEEPVLPSGSSLEELQWSLDRMLAATKKPALFERDGRLVEIATEGDEGES